MTVNDWIGTAGVSLILIAYFCSTFKIISAQGAFFFLLNTLGAGLACYASYLILYWPFVILEGVWTLVSLAGLIKSTR
jgi:hypothetical protein